MGYHSDMGPVMETSSFNGYDADDEVFASCAVHKGDKVMIQSKISGKSECTMKAHTHEDHMSDCKLQLKFDSQI